MEEMDISSMLENMMGTLKEPPVLAPVEILVKSSCDVDLQRMIEDRIYGLISQEAITPDQMTLLATLLRGYRPCAR